MRSPRLWCGSYSPDCKNYQTKEIIYGEQLMTVRITCLIAVMLLGVCPAPNPKVLKLFSPAFEYSVCLRLFSCLKSVTELLYYVVLLETLVFTCVIHSGLIESLLLGKEKIYKMWQHSRCFEQTSHVLRQPLSNPASLGKDWYVYSKAIYHANMFS